MSKPPPLPRYDIHQSYAWNYEHVPSLPELDVPGLSGDWKFCGLPVGSPLGVPAGPLLNGGWCLYYARLGFDVVTYKTVRSIERECYPLPNLNYVRCGSLRGDETNVASSDDVSGSWAVSFGMPSKAPSVWRADIEATRKELPAEKLLAVSVVGTVQDGWTLDDLAGDYARCAKWAVESGADCIETNFSCPNVSTCDGQLYQHPADSRLIASAVREAIGDTPFIVKVGSVASEEMAESLVDSLGDIVNALAMTNSIATTVSDGEKVLFDGQKRGICGAAILEASVTQTQMFADAIRRKGLSLDLIGVGGASSAADVRRYLDAGAHAVHLATAAMINPAIAIDIRRGLAVGA